MRFESSLELLHPLPVFSPEIIREEQSQCRVPCDEGLRGGPVHRAFVEALPPDWRADPQVEIFSRLLWVREGWLPMSLGYHCDWASETGGRVETLMANFGGCSHTEFVAQPFTLPDPPDPASRWRRWGEQITALVARGALKTTRLPDGVLARFDNAAWHRAMPATQTGWRLLIRAVRGLDEARRYRGQGAFTSVRNSFLPVTPDEIARYAPYR